MTTAVIVATRGLALGLMYRVVALGFVVVYRATRVLNVAHGAIGAVVVLAVRPTGLFGARHVRRI